MVWAVQTSRPYLAFERLTVYTDHAALHWLLNISEPSGRLMQWRIRFSEFDFSIQYKRGKINTQADALSRLRTDVETEYVSDEDEIPVFSAEQDEEHEQVEFMETDFAEADVFTAESGEEPREVIPVTAEEILKGQLDDELCQEARRRINAGVPTQFANDSSGILMRMVEMNPQIVVPFTLRARILETSHYAKLAGHPGERKLYYSLRRHFYWPSMAVDTYGVVRQCATCARNRIKLRKHAAALKLFPARAPLEFVVIDILGELVKTPRGNRYLLVMTDRYTKLTKVVPLKQITAPLVAQEFVTHWVYNYGANTDLAHNRIIGKGQHSFQTCLF